MNKKAVKYFRQGLLALFLILITIAAYMHQTLGGGEAPSIHALCPYGGLESLYTVFTQGTFIQKIFSGTLILLAIVLVVAVLFRRSFCGLICPFGAIQEFFGGLGQKIFHKKLVMPRAIDRPLRYLKYVVLFATLFYAWQTAGLWMAPYDPWAAYAHLSEGLISVWEEAAVGLIILILTIVGSMLYDRFFCKYLCPMGAFLGIVSKVSPHKIRREESKCVHCKACNKVCPVNIDVENSQEITSAECINCQACVLSCPKEGALEIKQGKKTVSSLMAILLVLSLFFIPVFVTQAFGIYKVLPTKLAPGQVIELNEVKGYMTIKEAMEATQYSQKEFYEKFEIPENVPTSVKLKEIKNIVPEYEFSKVKENIE